MRPPTLSPAFSAEASLHEFPLKSTKLDFLRALCIQFCLFTRPLSAAASASRSTAR